ncbi:MAG: hypothetical protein RIR91_1663, partial [Verrucomicrobiota bacterium]
MEGLGVGGCGKTAVQRCKSAFGRWEGANKEYGVQI